MSRSRSAGDLVDAVSGDQAAVLRMLSKVDEWLAGHRRLRVAARAGRNAG